MRTQRPLGIPMAVVGQSLLLLPHLLTSACLMSTAEPDAESVQPINGPSSSASAFQLARALFLANCTATRISAQFALTARHCGPNKGNVVFFYTAGPSADLLRTASVEQVIPTPGTTLAGCNAGDCVDTSGLYADIVLLRLSTSITRSDDSLTGPHATLAWRYPGSDVAGSQVGAGNHNGEPNALGVLRQVTDTTDDNSDSDGQFKTTTDYVDNADSGGPFYVNNKIVGVLSSQGWDPLDGNYARYTSVPKHLDWILSNIGYVWTGSPAQHNTKYQGTLIESFYGTELKCQYACEKTASCEAYNYALTTAKCELRTQITQATASVGVRGALHYGASSGNSNTIVGYVRSDGYNSVLRSASNGHIHEIYSDASGLSVGDISNNNPPAPAGKLSAYRRADGINAVVYRSAQNRIIEIALVDGWDWADLTSWGGLTAAGDPVGYVRDDGVSAVVFRSANGHINELRLGTKGWLPTDLTEASGAGVISSSDPSAYVRSDGYSSVVFRSGTQIWELYKAHGGTWNAGSPSQLAPGSPGAAGRPFGYTHLDGTNAIAYRSNDNRVMELWLDSAGWHAEQLSSGHIVAIGDPTAYVRTDGVTSVLYRSASNNIFELTLSPNPLIEPWQEWNLSHHSGAGPTTTNPAVYIRGDGYNTVVFGHSGTLAGQIAWKRGDASWTAADLSTFAGENP